MSLNWDARNIQYFKDHPDELNVEVPDSYGNGKSTYTDLNVETKSLVFGTMAIGIGNITDKNYLDFYARWKTLEKLDSSFYLYSSFNDNEKICHKLTLDVVKKHIGLVTNVGFESLAKWSERMSSPRNRFSNQMTKKEISAYVTVFKKETAELENSNVD